MDPSHISTERHVNFHTGHRRDVRRTVADSVLFALQNCSFHIRSPPPSFILQLEQALVCLFCFDFPEQYTLWTAHICVLHHASLSLFTTDIYHGSCASTGEYLGERAPRWEAGGVR